ncbi:hypothetical protein [Rhodoferax aquaticus]|uniref:hypothetical protein n=1 Tax=Rhodoferax aquaticus TaxID=2527691 RepID=UPI00143D1A90|nr:hypothetical protein [Rhodoferax aquaticus]
MTPEQKARVSIDALIDVLVWHVCDLADVDINLSVPASAIVMTVNLGTSVCAEFKA